MQRRCINISNIVVQVSVGAQLANDHNWRLLGILGYTDPELK